MAGIKESMDVLKAAEAAFDAVIAAGADKKLSVGDVKHLLAPAKAALEAYRGVGEVVTELKDVDEAELVALVQQGGVLATKAVAALEAATSLWPAA